VCACAGERGGERERVCPLRYLLKYKKREKEEKGELWGSIISSSFSTFF
jgi:hypothetical protein